MDFHVFVMHKKCWMVVLVQLTRTIIKKSRRNLIISEEYVVKWLLFMFIFVLIQKLFIYNIDCECIISIFANITLGGTFLPILFLNIFLTLTLRWMIFFRPDTLNAQSGSSVPSSMKILRDLLDILKPFIILCQYKFSLGNLIANSKPSISDIIIGTKKLYSFSSKAKSFNYIVYFWRFW